MNMFVTKAQLRGARLHLHRVPANHQPSHHQRFVKRSASNRAVYGALDVCDAPQRRTDLQQTAAAVEALRIVATSGDSQDAQNTLETLQQLLSQHSLEKVLRDCPQLLSVDIGTWEAFFTAYGAGDTFLPRLIERAPRFFLSACLFTAGNVLLALRMLGIDPEEALELIVLDTPGVLSVPGQQIADRIENMRLEGLSDAEVADEILRDPMGTLC